MTFAETLEKYLAARGLKASGLAERAGLSKATVSRFKTGKREPAAGSETMRRLAEALAGGGESAEAVQEALARSLKAPAVDHSRIAENLNMLIDALTINVNDLSRYLKFDASYLSRIRAGKRRPANVRALCGGVADFVAKGLAVGDRAALVALTGCAEGDIDDPIRCRQVVLEWLSEGAQRQEDAVRHFFRQLDSFDLNDYLRAVRFDDMAVPETMAPPPMAKSYTGVAGFMEAELDWLRATVLAPAMEPVFFYSDLPMEDMSRDMDFARMYMTGMALMLKKGLHLDVVHNVDRSFNEMMLGLESWIPLYMTGQVSPYYFRGTQDAVFHHMLWVSGEAALAGEAVAGAYQNGQLRLDRSRAGVVYARTRADDLLSKAVSLMDIYRGGEARAYQSFLRANLEAGRGPRRGVLFAPPLYSITPELLSRILRRSGVTGDDARRIEDYVEDCRAAFEARVSRYVQADELSVPDEEEFARYPAALPLADIFYDRELVYTFEEYREHVALTEALAGQFENYRLTLSRRQPFRNIQIRIAEGEFAVISKNRAPAIHFVIKHPKLRQAIENMTVPVFEGSEKEG